MEWCRACGGRLTADEDLCPWCRAPNPMADLRPRDRFPDPVPHRLDDEDEFHEHDDGPAFAPRRPARPVPADLRAEESFARDAVSRADSSAPPQAGEAPRRDLDRDPPPTRVDDPRDRAWLLEEPAGEPSPASALLPRAHFLQRSAAFVIDLVILAMMNGAVFFVTLAAVGFARKLRGSGDPGDLFAALFTAGQIGLLFGYFGVLHAGPGQTIGKALLGLRVISLDGADLALRQSLLRAGAYVFSALPLGFGFLLAGLPPWRALHDYLVGSRVVRIGAS